MVMARAPFYSILGAVSASLLVGSATLAGSCRFQRSMGAVSVAWGPLQRLGSRGVGAKRAETRIAGTGPLQPRREVQTTRGLVERAARAGRAF
jgi:hypothetical protein